MAHHHCGCRLLPPDAEDRLRARLQDTPMILAGVLEDVGLAPTTVPLTRHRRHFSEPDAKGHVRYLGKMPANRAQPVITLRGERIPAARYTKAVFANSDPGPDATLKRGYNCSVPECFAPDHWVALTAPIRAGRSQAQDLGILEVIYLSRYGTAPNYQPSSWVDGDTPFEHLCPLMHPGLKVPDFGHKGRSYCATCYRAYKTWHRKHKDWQRERLRYGLTGTEEYLLKLWNAEPLLRDQLGVEWRLLDDYFAAHPHDGRDPEEVDAELTGLAEPEPAPMSMYESIADLLAEIGDDQ